MATDYDQIIGRLREVRRRQWGWQANCPSHETGNRKHNQSLSVRIGRTGALVLKCHAGCSLEQIVGALGVEKRELFPPRGQRRQGGERMSKVEATYDYQDEQGQLLYQVVRFAPKTFRQRVPGPKPGTWTWGLGNVRRVLFRLPQLLADKSRAVVVVEGEKDVLALERLGLLATTNVGGALKWSPESDQGTASVPGHRYAASLAGRTCILIGDADPVDPKLGFSPGQRHLELVGAALAPHAKRVSVIATLPGVGPKGDVSDWIAAGGTRQQLEELARAAPLYGDWIKQRGGEGQAPSAGKSAAAVNGKSPQQVAAERIAAKVHLPPEDFRLVCLGILAEFREGVAGA